MREEARVGQVVSVITVTDRDLEDRGRALVTITGGNQADHFTLDAVGSVQVVRVGRELYRDTARQYELTITAEDRGTPPRTATAALVINVESDN